MAVFKSLLSNDIKSSKSVLNQLVDIVREDVSGSNSRKSYEVFVTSSFGPGVTSSLYQTVFDQDFSLQTANSLFDMTFGFYHGSGVATNTTDAPGAYITNDTAGKRRYKHTSLMMREKQDIYKQFAATLLGNPEAAFKAPYGANTSTTTNDINAALFISFHRLFVRDGIKRETFAMRMNHNIANHAGGLSAGKFPDNLFQTQGQSEVIYTDFGSSQNQPESPGGGVGSIVKASNTNDIVGLIFYDHGTVVLDVEKVFSKTDVGHGIIDAMTATASSGSANSVYTGTGRIPAGKALFGPPLQTAANELTFGKNGPGDATIPDNAITAGGTMWPYFWSSGSIDNIVTHVCSTRFGSDAGTAITFQNKTEINSTIYFIRAQPDEFNYSSNPSYVTQTGQIVVTDSQVNSLEKPFSYITTVGLYGDYDDLLAVAKVSRPIEKNDEKDLTIRVRLDF